MEAYVISVDLDVAHMADLLNGSEGLARNAFPGGGGPILEVSRDGCVVGFE